MIEPLMKLLIPSAKRPIELISANSFWCALLVHGCFEGLATGGLKGPIRWVVIGVLFPHKIVEYAALTSSLMLAEVPVMSWTYWTTMMTAEIPTMICFIVAWLAFYKDTVMSTDPHVSSDGLFSSLCAGTFLFLSLGHLMPEALELGHAHVHMTRAEVDAALDKKRSSDVGITLDAETGMTETVDEGAMKVSKSLRSRVLVYAAIALGWITFALFALAPDGGSGNDDVNVSNAGIFSNDSSFAPSFR
jgi:hypothetical protein